MEINKAREMLELDTTKYSDEQVEEIIRHTERLAQLFIRSFKHKCLSNMEETVYNEIADENQDGAHGLARS